MAFLIVEGLDVMRRISGIWHSRSLFHRYSLVRIVIETVSSILLKRHIVVIVARFHHKFVCWGVLSDRDDGVSANRIEKLNGIQLSLFPFVSLQLNAGTGGLFLKR